MITANTPNMISLDLITSPRCQLPHYFIILETGVWEYRSGLYNKGKIAMLVFLSSYIDFA